ncbi:MAG: hypothetical protein JWO40_737 [Candidatus Doudnabacteria bacterium]|nr:hypothetical protein [Candidatus Doudnabacteria bacterium]
MAKFYNKSSYLRGKELLYTSLFLLCLLAVIGGIKWISIYLSGTPDSLYFLYLMMIILIVIFYKLSKIFLIKSDLYAFGIVGEQAIGRELKKLSDDYIVLHNLKIEGVGDIDYVVIGPNGVFAVEVKSHRGRFSYKDPRINRFVRQTNYEAQQLRRYIQKRLGLNIWVFGILALSRGKLLNGPRESESIFITEKRDLLTFIESYNKNLGNFNKSAQEIANLFG